MKAKHYIAFLIAMVCIFFFGYLKDQSMSLEKIISGIYVGVTMIGCILYSLNPIMKGRTK